MYFVITFISFLSVAIKNLNKIGIEFETMQLDKNYIYLVVGQNLRKISLKVVQKNYQVCPILAKMIGSIYV